MRTIYKICDNLLGISELQDNFIDLTITSPPYDNLRSYGGYCNGCTDCFKEHNTTE